MPNSPRTPRKNKEKYWKKFPKTAKVVLFEGGQYVDFEEGKPSYLRQVHAIVFEDGRVWDCAGGWRKELHEGFEKK